MAKQQNVTWSDAHTSKGNPQPHRDVHSQSSDSSKNPKVGHALVDSGSSNSDSSSSSNSNSSTDNKGK